MAILASGCSGSGAPGSELPGPVSPHALDRIAAKVHSIMVETGLPLQNGHIGCDPNGDLRSDACYGETAGTPVKTVEGDFVASSAQPPPGACPGTLTVSDGTSEVTSIPLDPCR